MILDPKKGANSLRVRCVVEELMDAPAIDRRQHRHALRSLRRLNRWSRSDAILWPSLMQIAKRVGRPLMVLDVATGAGDVPLALARRAAKAGVPVELHGCDKSDTAVGYAQEQAQRRGLPVRFFQRDVVAEGIPDGYDVIIASLFFHHLHEAEAITLLTRMTATARHLVLVNDLARGWLGLVLAYVASRVFTLSPVVRVDAPRSVRAAFRPEEMHALAFRSGAKAHRITRRWPCRFLLEVETDGYE